MGYWYSDIKYFALRTKILDIIGQLFNYHTTATFYVNSLQNFHSSQKSFTIPEGWLYNHCVLICMSPSWWRHMSTIASPFTCKILGCFTPVHWPHDCLFKTMFRQTSKQHQSPALLALCEGNPPVTGGFPSQRASNAESISISWSHFNQEWSPIRIPPHDWLQMICVRPVALWLLTTGQWVVSLTSDPYRTILP